MRKLRNRVLILLMMLALVVSVLPATVLANSETESPFEGWSLTLGDNLDVNFYFNIAEADEANTIANITVAGNTAAVNAADAVIKDGVYVFTVDMAAAQMTDVISVELVTNETVVHSGEYSIRQYAETILAGEYDSATKELVLQMLGYGAAAQNYFGYKTESLANAGYENQISTASVPESIDSIAVEGSVEGIKLYGMSLVFESKIAVRFYYSVSGDVNNYTFSDGENTYKLQPKDGLYYVEVTGINPQDYSNVISMSVSDGTDSMTVGYSPLHYIVRKNNGGDSASLKTLVQALYGYHLEASEFAQGNSSGVLELSHSFDMNVAENDFVISSDSLDGNLISVAVKDTEIELANASLENNALTIPAASFQLDAMPSGKLTLEVTTDSKAVDITGEFVWVINTQDELYAMKNHLVAAEDGKTYTGSLALGADINPGTGYLSVSNSVKFFESSDVFAGTFDGRGHTVYKVFTQVARNSLFSNVSGTIKNLRMENCYVKQASAALVGQILTGTVENVYIHGTIQDDGLAESGNWTYQGCGLLAGQLKTGASVKNCIVNVKEIQTNALEVGTAFGKLNTNGMTEAVFENCYAINASGEAYMIINGQSGDKYDFALETNGNFATLVDLWSDEAAATLAVQLGLKMDDVQTVLDQPFDMNVAGNNLELSVVRAPESIVIQGTDITLTGTWANGKLTIPAEQFMKDTMPSGTLTLEITTALCNYEITGEFVWVINSQEELFAMKSHLTKSGTTYNGSLALGADIIPEKYVTVNYKAGNYIFTKAETFAGVFDGRNYEINSILAQNNEICLFPKVTGTIKNLRLTSAYVQACNSALVLELAGTIENVYVQGTIQKDGLSAYDNTKGCGLLACKISDGAKIKNCIVDVTGFHTTGADNGIASAYGKLLENVNEADVFENCYAVNADGHTFTLFNATQSERANFAEGSTSKNFATMADLWADEDAAKLAEETFLLLVPERTTVTIDMEESYDMNVADNDFVLENTDLKGALKSVTIQGTEFTLEGATLQNGVLTIPAASFQQDAMPSGNLTLVITTTSVDCSATGEFVWVINNQEELFAMKSHLTKSGTVYNGSVALGADILPSKYVNVNSNAGYYIFTKAETFAGVFDGRHHKINKILAQTNEICLFPKVTGTIKNLRLTSAYVQACNSALVQELAGTIENVYVQGTIQKDGLSAYDNTKGCGLLACKISDGAKIKNCIVDVTGFHTTGADNGIASAYGKLLENVNEADVFENCYAVNADGYTFTLFNATQSERANFAEGSTSKNFATMTELWADATAAALAEALGLIQ